jgi:hypothetical protein
MDLPLIHKLIEAYKLWQEYLVHFPRTAKYTLGAKIDQLFIEMTELVYCASYMSADKKLACVKKSSAKLDLLKFFLRIAWETKVLDNKKYIALSKRLDEIGRMLGGWINDIYKKLPH